MYCWVDSKPYSYNKASQNTIDRIYVEGISPFLGILGYIIQAIEYRILKRMI
jgi:hypothetical protein